MQKEYSSILDEYKRRGYLETQQHLRLEQIYERICFLKGKNSIISTSESPPDGWIRPPCYICGGPHGVVVDPNDNKGKIVLDHLKDWYHDVCRKKEQEAKTKKDVSETQVTTALGSDATYLN